MKLKVNRARGWDDRLSFCRVCESVDFSPAARAARVMGWGARASPRSIGRGWWYCDEGVRRRGVCRVIRNRRVVFDYREIQKGWLCYCLEMQARFECSVELAIWFVKLNTLIVRRYEFFENYHNFSLDILAMEHYSLQFLRWLYMSHTVPPPILLHRIINRETEENKKQNPMNRRKYFIVPNYKQSGLLSHGCSIFAFDETVFISLVFEQSV